MLVAHISDPHVDYQDPSKARRLAYIISELKAQTPDLWLFTGDLTQNGRMEEYEVLQRLLPDCGQVLALPGNHDDSGRVARLFENSAPPPQSLRSVAFSDAGLRLVLIDSTVPGKGHGYCGPELIEELDNELKKSRLPTVLAMHHPPIDAQMPVMADYELQDADAFIDCLSAHNHVVGVLAGHHHKVQFGMVGGNCPVIIAPSTAPGLPLDFGATKFHAHPAPPAALLHCWIGGIIRTHLFLPAVPMERCGEELL